MNPRPENPYEGREAVMFNFACDAAEEGECFFYVRIPADIEPLERAARFEDALEESLERSEAGRVTGGGSQLGEGGTVEFCGIDVVMRDRNAGLNLLKAELRRLEVPQGTVIEEYLPSRADHPVFD